MAKLDLKIEDLVICIIGLDRYLRMGNEIDSEMDIQTRECFLRLGVGLVRWKWTTRVMEF